MITVPTSIGELPLAAAAGFGAGIGYFALLWRSVRISPLAGAGRAAALLPVRLAVAAIFFWSMTRLGPGCVIAAFLGFLAARLAAVQRLWEPR